MIFKSKVWLAKDGFWLVEIPELDLMTQATKEEDIPGFIKEIIELLVDEPGFFVEVKLGKDQVEIISNDQAKLLALQAKRLKLR